MLVDGCTDDDDDVLGLADDGGIRRCCQVTRIDRLAEHRFCTRFEKWNDSAVHQVDGRFAHVVDADLRTSIGEGDRQRQTDVAGPADDDDILLET